MTLLDCFFLCTYHPHKKFTIHVQLARSNFFSLNEFSDGVVSLASNWLRWWKGRLCKDGSCMKSGGHSTSHHLSYSFDGSSHRKGPLTTWLCRCSSDPCCSFWNLSNFCHPLSTPPSVALATPFLSGWNHHITTRPILLPFNTTIINGLSYLNLPPSLSFPPTPRLQEDERTNECKSLYIVSTSNERRISKKRTLYLHDTFHNETWWRRSYSHRCTSNVHYQALTCQARHGNPRESRIPSSI